MANIIYATISTGPIPEMPQNIPGKAADSGLEGNYIGKLLELCIKHSDWSQPVLILKSAAQTMNPK